jgi:hypothetical protein
MVFNEHSNFGHASYGAKMEHEEMLKVRAENPRQLIFQGLERHIPAAEHATVFTAPGPNEVHLLPQFELAYKLDGGPVTGHVTSLFGLPQRSVGTGTFETEGVDYDAARGTPRAEVVQPGVCTVATTVYSYRWQ